MASILPSFNGRNGAGRFTKGNSFGKGNPFSKKVALLRATLIKSVSAGDVKKIIKSLVRKAQEGDTAAAKIILPYLIGQPFTNQEIEQQNNQSEADVESLSDAELMAIARGGCLFNVVETVVETVDSSRVNR